LALIFDLDESIGINDPTDQLVLCEPKNDNAFGYHDFFTISAGHKFLLRGLSGVIRCRPDGILARQ
jgi:hypothetical protein